MLRNIRVGTGKLLAAPDLAFDDLQGHSATISHAHNDFV